MNFFASDSFKTENKKVLNLGYNDVAVSWEETDTSRVVFVEWFRYNNFNRLGGGPLINYFKANKSFASFPYSTIEYNFRDWCYILK